MKSGDGKEKDNFQREQAIVNFSPPAPKKMQKEIFIIAKRSVAANSRSVTPCHQRQQRLHCREKLTFGPNSNMTGAHSVFFEAEMNVCCVNIIKTASVTYS